MAGKNLPFSASEIAKRFGSSNNRNRRRRTDDDFTKQLRESVEQEKAGISVLQVLLESSGEHIWKNNGAYLNDVEIGIPVSKNKPATIGSFNEGILEGTVPDKIAVLTAKAWEIKRQELRKQYGLIQDNDDVNSIFSLMTGNEFVRGGNFLNVYSSKIGAIFKTPVTENSYDYWTSQENMEFFKSWTGDIDFIKFNEVLKRIPHFRSILESDIEFYRSYLDGVTNVPLPTSLLEKLKTYSPEQIEIHYLVDMLIKSFNHNLYLPESIKNTVTQVKSENTVEIVDYVRGNYATFSKKRSSEQTNSLDSSDNWKIMNPTHASKNIFGGVHHSFQRSNTNKLLKQLGVHGLLDQTVTEQGRDGGYSFSEYYLDILSQTNNQLRTLKLKDINSTIVNAKNSLKKISYIPLNIVIIDNVVYTTSTSLSMEALSEGKHTNIEVKSQSQMMYIINKILSSDNFGYVPVEQAGNIGDEMVRLQTAIFNKALVDNVYDDIINKEVNVNDRLNKVYASFSGDEQRKYLDSDHYLEEMFNAKTVMDKYLFNSVNMPEHVPGMSMLECYTGDVLVSPKANGLLGTSSIVKNRSQQYVLNYNVSQIVPETKLYDLIYGQDEYYAEDYHTLCLKTCQSMISDLLTRTCSKEAVITLLDDLAGKSIGKSLNEQIIINEMKNTFMADLYDVGRVANLNYLIDVVRDLFMAHYTRFLELSELIPLGVLVSVDRSETAEIDAPNYEKKRLMFYSFESQSYIDADILGMSGITNMTSSRTNLLTTGLFSEILIKSPSVGYKLNREELLGLDRQSCSWLVKSGVKNGNSRAYYKSFYPFETMMNDLFTTKAVSPLSKKYTTVCQTLGDPMTIKESGSSRISPNVNAIPYVHLMLSDKIYTSGKTNKAFPKQDSSKKDKITVQDNAFISNEYVRAAEPTVDKMYYRLSKNFCKKYTNVTESMNIVHDYQAVPFIDREKLTKIGERFCIFESIFLNVLFCLVKELNNVISTSDNRERRKRIDDIFNGVINVDLTRLEDVEEDELNNGKSKKGAAIQIPSMEDLILNVLQKADYFD